MNKRVKYVINFAGMLVVIASAVIGNVICNIFESQINSFYAHLFLIILIMKLVLLVEKN